jgi:5,10-methylenetetrahydrofolate reductase
VALADRLRALPVVLEIVPPHRRSGEKATERFLDRVRSALEGLPTLDAVNFPEIVDENRIGSPYYRHVDPRRLASHLDDGPVDAIVNKVVAHLPDVARLRAYLRESIEAYGLRNFVFAGGSSSRRTYPGPDVVTANEVLRDLAGDRSDVTCGNILIPEREAEVDRMIAKTRAGCRFFTTQVLFQAEPVTSVLRAYGKACGLAGLSPASVLLSFAPVTDRADIELLTWLGASIPPRVEVAIASKEDGEGSLALARDTFRAIQRAVDGTTHRVPLGVNIEEISAHNFDLAIRLARDAATWSESAT